MSIKFNKLGNYGRLGNQMFQYATLLSIGHKCGYDVEIPEFDFEIKQFNLTAKTTTNYKIYNSYTEPKFSFNEDVFSINDNTNLLGYFQSEKYFIEISDIIKKEFTFPNKIMDLVYNSLNQLKDNVLIGVHVRRTDYLGLQDIHPTCSIKYYENCFDYFRTKYKNCKFIVVSDDPQWCKHTFLYNDVLVAYSGNGFTDMALISNCHHNIIANSSFSWWAAWLNNNPDKKIIYPTPWFGPNGPQDTEDLIPENWIKEAL